MILYHASQKKLETIKRSQASVPHGVEVPDAELQNKIYVTPDLGFALAMAAGPNGITRVKNDTISFEYADDFDPRGYSVCLRDCKRTLSTRGCRAN